MYKSIQYLQEIGIHKFENDFEEFYSDPGKLAEFIINLQKHLNEWGCQMIKEALETVDLTIKDSHKRKADGYVVDQKDVKKELITSLGELHYRKTYYYNKLTNDYCFLVDKVVGLDANDKITDDALALMYKEAVQTSYRKGGEIMCANSVISKQTVKNHLHVLKFPAYEAPTEKRTVKYLYIEADEDHVAKQFNEHKGDLEVNEWGRKNNCMIEKLVYVHEGVEPVAPKSKRHRLINPHYFCGSSYGCTNKDFWDKVYQYIEDTYDIENIETIYLNADGGNWINEGKDRIVGTKYVLDEFHLNKYMTKMTSHMLDTAEDARNELKSAIREGKKKEFKDVVERLEALASRESTRKNINVGKEYIENNWDACRLRLKKTDGVIGCSAEGHVSHTLSSRMSSRPMGWSELGALKMAQLRAYYLNGGDFLELAAYQRTHLPMVSGGED
ncbi:MAG: ISLre2 family transposase, partial [Pseudobutyrivibrio sp.]|nr:ISLre2 family transposase [Pseudobutyrivibrio sp.]